jgi:hypothetical protein
MLEVGKTCFPYGTSGGFDFLVVHQRQPSSGRRYLVVAGVGTMDM